MRSLLALLLTMTITLPSGMARAEMLTVSQYGRITATLPWAVALKKGFFKDVGLNITDITSSSGGGTTLRNMLAGDLPFAEVSTSAVIAGLKAGVDLKVVMATSNHIGDLAFAALPNKGINSIKDLVGKRVAFTSPKSTTEVVIRHALKAENLTGKVDVLALGGLGPALTALAQGGIDAAPLNDPPLTLQAEKYKVLFYASDYFPKFTWALGVTTPEFLQREPDKVRKLIGVHRRAVEYMQANQEETAQIYAELWNFSPDDARKLLPKYFKWGHWSRGEISKEGLAAYEQGMIDVGELDKPLDWSKIVDESLLDPDLRQTQ